MSGTPSEILLERLREAGLSIAVAESLTAGMLASELAAVAGASDVFVGGVVAYSNAVKQSILGVSAQSLESAGAVSEDVAVQMAQGVQEAFGAASGLTANDVVSLATTGVAGPSQAEGKPVGTVFIAARLGGRSLVQSYHFDGDRQQIREFSSRAAIALAEQLLDGAL